jgi:glycosyltransferase involved in cell wall biosynthesis
VLGRRGGARRRYILAAPGPVRILIVSHYAMPHVGGVERITDELAAGLGARGHDVTLLASNAGAAPGATAGRGHRVVRVRAWNAAERALGVPYPVLGPAVLTAAARGLRGADVVHAHGFLQLAPLLVLAAPRRAGARRPVRVLTEHVGHVPYAHPAIDVAERAAIATLGRFAARRADALVAYNATVARTLAELAPGTAVHAIQNGVDARFRPPAPGEREALRAALGWDPRPRVLFVGRAVAKKGLETAAAAVARVPGAVLAVAGRDDLPPGLPGEVALLGVLGTERLAGAYRAADALVLPSRGEGLPLVVGEALASGLPVVLSDDPGYRATLTGAGPGLRLVAPEPAALAAALGAVARDRALRAAAAAVTAPWAAARFSWDTAVAAHERLYTDLLRGH